MVQNAAIYFFELAIITFIGVLIACKILAYEISMLRKVGAATSFAILNTLQIPIPFMNIILPAVSLYVCLMDDTYNRSTVNKAFWLTFGFAVVATLIVHYLNK